MHYERGIPPELPENEKKQIYEALINHHQCRLTDKATRACATWGISGVQLRGHIQKHFMLGRKIYKKPDGLTYGKSLLSTGQANICIHDDFEVYVSLSFRSVGVLSIDAHVHTTSWRLPR